MVKNKPELDADPRLFDYLIAKLLFWKGKTLPIPESEERIIEISGQADIDDKSKSRNDDKGLTHLKKSKGFFFFGFILLFIAQLSVELSSGKPSWLAGVLFVIGLFGLVFAFMFNKTKTDKEAMETNPAGKAKSVNWLALTGAVLLSLFNFFLWRNNGIGWVQVLVCLISVALMAYLSHEKPNVDSIDDELSPAKRLKPIRWKRQYDRGYVLVLLIVVLVVFLFKILFIQKTQLN